MNLLAPLNGEMKLTIGMADNTLYSYNYDADGGWKNQIICLLILKEISGAKREH